MRIATLLTVAFLAAALAAPTVAEAGSGYVKGKLVLRAGPGAKYREIVVIPERTRVGVYHCAAWCEITYGRYRGYASATFVARGSAKFADRLTITPVKLRKPSIATPIYVKPQDAYITTTLSRCPKSRPQMRIWYYDARFLDRPDYFMIVER